MKPEKMKKEKRYLDLKGRKNEGVASSSHEIFSARCPV
jgi:hypothetical protein